MGTSGAYRGEEKSLLARYVISVRSERSQVEENEKNHIHV